jgi:transcriptional/translational regulatory protein YebC/TACO1
VIATTPESYLDVKEAVEAAGIDIESSDVSLLPSNYVTPDAETARKIIRLVEALEDHDDVENVATNMDIPDDVLAEMS